MSDVRRILVVDDDREMARTLSDVLELQGWEATTVHSGEDAVEAVAERTFSLVLMDIRMSGISGVEALKRIRSARPGARIILMTAYSASELVEEAVKEGALEVISKPVVLTRLLELVENVSTAPGPVLVVDDDPLFLRALCDGLGERGIETRAAGDLVEALRLLEEEAIGVVLLDLKLDGLTGVDSIGAIREVRPGILLVLFSGYPEALRRTEEELPPGWIVGSLTKPFDPGQLLELLEPLR